jgi:hypothetical protein
VLQVANTQLAREAQRLLTNYLTLQNQHDFTKVRAFYSPRFAGNLTAKQDRDKHRTSYFFNPRLTDLAPDGSSVRMAYNVMYAPTATGAGGQNCSRLDTTFYLVRSRGRLVLDRTVKASDPVACDTD